MKISVRVSGLDTLRAQLAGYGDQIPFAAARALTMTAQQAHESLRAALRRDVQGGPTPYTLRAFRVVAARKTDLAARLELRTDGPGGGTPYSTAVGHLLTGGRRKHKLLEDRLRSKGILPPGLMIIPGRAIPLDARGNIRRAALAEMLGVVFSSIRNLGVHRKAGKSKGEKRIGYFVVPTGKRLHAGIWQRIDSAAGSAIQPWLMFVRPGSYRRRFEMDRVAQKTVDERCAQNFRVALAAAAASRRP